MLISIFVLLLVGCVDIPMEETTLPEGAQDMPFEPQTAMAEEKLAEKPVENATPNPLAPLPLPNKTNASTTAVRPKSVPANSTNTTVTQGWTTESLSIAEGETKYVYIK